MSASTLAVASTSQSLGVATILPSGIISGVAGSATITLTGITGLTSTSVVQATIQVPDAAGSGQSVWLVSATPSSATGGTITITLATACSSPTALKVAWAVIKF